MEGIQLYVMLVEVFEAERSRVRYYYTAAYGNTTIGLCFSSFTNILGRPLFHAGRETEWQGQVVCTGGRGHLPKHCGASGLNM